MPVDGLQRLERDVSKFESTDGGTWLIYLADDGRLHSLLRTDYGETGQSRLQVWFLDRQTYAIRDAVIRYRTDYRETGGAKIAQDKSVTYAFCDDTPYLSVTNNDANSAAEANQLRRRVLEAPEIAEFIAKVPESH